MKVNFLIVFLVFLTSVPSFAQERMKNNNEKLADDPTKVITKFGASYANNYHFEDANVSFSGSFALDEARKINVRLNHDASEWRVGGSWLFPVGIVNFNFGKNEYINGANQTNYSIGTFIPLSFFGIEPMGIQIFPMAGYTYNDGEFPVCRGQGACSGAGFNGDFSAENGFEMMVSTNSSGYVGMFSLKPLTKQITLMGFAAGSYGSENEDGENYKGFFAGIGVGYLISKRHSFSLMTFVMDNNTYLDEPDNRLIASYQYQFD